MSAFSLSKVVMVKELREALRDRRTVLLTLVIPLLFYPLLVGVFGFFAGRSLMENETRKLNVAVYGEDAFIAELGTHTGEDEAIVFTSMGAGILRDRRPVLHENFDVVITAQRGEGKVVWEVRSQYKSTAEGNVAKRRVDQVLARWQAKINSDRLANLGLAEGDITPVQLVWEDTATVVVSHGREAAGMLVYFILFLSFTACLSMAVDVGAGEKERGTMETLLTTPAHRGAIFSGKLGAVVVVGCTSTFCSVLGFGAVIAMGMMSDAEMQQLAGDLLRWDALVLALALLGTTILLLASVTLAVSMRASSAKQAQALLAPLLMIVVLALVTVTTPSVALDSTTAWIPVLNSALAVRALLTAELYANWMIVLSAVITLVSIAVMIWLGSRALKSERAIGE